MADAPQRAEHVEGWRRRHVPFRTQFSANLTDWGLTRSLHWALMNQLARFFGLHVHYVRVGADRDDLRDPEVPEVPPGYTFRIVGLEDLLRHEGQAPGLTRAFLEDAFSHGDEAAACFHDGMLVSFDFKKRSRAPVTDQLDVLVPPGFRYGYKTWTHPEHARRNLTRMLGFIQWHHPNRRYAERSISYVETHNYPSLLHGYRHPNRRVMHMGLAGWIEFFGRQIPFNSRQAKKIGFEFVRKEDPGQRQYIR